MAELSRKPLWLAAPSRFADLPSNRARILLALLVLLVVASLIDFSARPASRQNAPRHTDVALYAAIVEGVRSGGDYYTIAADAQRRNNYPVRPFVTVRLPTLALLEGHLPSRAMQILLGALCAAAFVAWAVRLRLAFARTPPFLISLAFLAGGMLAFAQPELFLFHEIWAGLLIALSLALWRPGRWATAALLALAAALIRETALLYAIVMGVLALRDGRRREIMAWLGVGAVFAILLAAHAHTVAQVVGPGDPTSPGWTGLLGFGFFAKAVSMSTALALAPLWLAAPLVALALFGWASWRDPVALRAATTFAAYALLLGLFGRPDTFYWGLLAAPTILAGLAFLPDGLRDVLSAARRRA